MQTLNNFIFHFIHSRCYIFSLSLFLSFCLSATGKDGELSGTMQDKSYDGNGPQIRADAINAQYTVETVVMAVLAAAIFALLVGFITGYFCGRRCHKDEDDNLPYPDTEYEYFEQRSNINR